MSEKISRLLLILEVVFIALPLSCLATVASLLAIWDMSKYLTLYSVVMYGSVFLISLLAIMSGWLLTFAYLRGGVISLRRQHFGWWVLTLVGVAILVGSFISYEQPYPIELSVSFFFRGTFDSFRYGILLLIPLCHLALEKFLRQSN